MDKATCNPTRKRPGPPPTGAPLAETKTVTLYHEHLCAIERWGQTYGTNGRAETVRAMLERAMGEAFGPTWREEIAP